jgi:hypothetical protein
MKYIICERTLGAKHEIEIDEAIFNEISASDRKLTELLAIEEKYFLLLQNFYELEKHFNDLALKSLLFHDYNWSSQINEINTTNRCVMNLLSSAKMYLDHIPQNLNEAFSPSTLESDEFQIQTNKQYDESFAYRVASALRNHAQHADFPIHSLNHNCAICRDSEIPTLRHTTTGYIEVSELERNIKFKSKCLAEIKSHGEKIDIKPIVRGYIASIANLQAWTRKTTEKMLDECTVTMSSWHAEFSSKCKENPMALSAVIANERGEHLDYYRITTSIADRIKKLQLHCPAQTTIDKQFISSEVKPSV